MWMFGSRTTVKKVRNSLTWFSHKGVSDQLHLTKALEPRSVWFAFASVCDKPHHAHYGGGGHEIRLLVSFVKGRGVQERLRVRKSRSV